MATSRKKAIRSLNAAIKELREARRFVERKRFERAEDEIGDSLRKVGKAIRQINKAEKK